MYAVVMGRDGSLELLTGGLTGPLAHGLRLSVCRSGSGVSEATWCDSGQNVGKSGAAADDSA